MATVNFINRPKGQTRGGLFAVLSYTMKAEKTAHEGRNLVSGVNCSPQSVYHEFINTKLLNEKCDGRMYYHFVQAFHKDENITPQTAHEIALKLADFYKGYEILVCTHTDREHIHSHFIVNSVNLETGKKLHQSAHAIQEIRLASDQLCMEYNLTLCQPREHKTKPMTAGEYHSAKRGNSWKMRLTNTIDECMQYATSKEMFLELMESEGYKVNWTNSRKYITYTTPEGNKCRDNKLHEQKYLKEMMENEFTIRRKIVFGTAETEEQATATATSSNREVQLVEGKCEQHILQPRLDIGLNRGNTVRDEHLEKQDGQLEQSDLRVTHQDGFGEVKQKAMGDGEDIITGWEKERATLLSAQTEIAENQLGSLALNTDEFSSLVGDIASLGRAVDSANQTLPVIDATTHIVVHERKRGHSHKEDDRESQEYKLTM